MDVPPCMVPILSCLLAGVMGFGLLLQRSPKPASQDLTAKERCENWFLAYGVFWISCFAVIVGFGVYEHMAQWSYLIVCGGLAAPLLLQPVVCPWLTKEENLALQERYCTKANLWIAIYSFLGNYWGTHYFYCVLKAKYTLPFLPAHQLNGVPICMYLATHFYFSALVALCGLGSFWAWDISCLGQGAAQRAWNLQVTCYTTTSESP
ncbi:unnamed protein product [Effrenium voratum]|uniref:Uncharacterized protein n=1 Tax=Effrenium voratum TaxID=2562239 RepID=A0AA36IGL5_9DINO|nr:unnamed protein product [Effrenium voratum]